MRLPRLVAATLVLAALPACSESGFRKSGLSILSPGLEDFAKHAGGSELVVSGDLVASVSRPHEGAVVAVMANAATASLVWRHELTAADGPYVRASVVAVGEGFALCAERATAVDAGTPARPEVQVLVVDAAGEETASASFFDERLSSCVGDAGAVGDVPRLAVNTVSGASHVLRPGSPADEASFPDRHVMALGPDVAVVSTGGPQGGGFAAADPLTGGIRWTSRAPDSGSAGARAELLAMGTKRALVRTTDSSAQSVVVRAVDLRSGSPAGDSVPDARPAPGSAPPDALVDTEADVAVVSTQSGPVAFDLATGQVRWKLPPDLTPAGTRAIAAIGGHAYFVTPDATVFWVDSRTGTKGGEASVGADLLRTAVVTASGRLFSTAGGTIEVIELR